MNKNNFFLTVLLTVFMSLNGLQAQEMVGDEPAANTGSDGSLYLGFGFNETQKLNRFDLGVDIYPQDWLVGVYGDLGVLMDADANARGVTSLWSLGASLGLRTNFGWVVEPYLGGGLFLGANGDTVSAENDNIDNDNDGSVDEDGETDVVNSGLGIGAKGEIGLRARLGVLRVLLAYQGVGLATTNGGQGSESGLYLAIGIGPEN